MINAFRHISCVVLCSKNGDKDSIKSYIYFGKRTKRSQKT